MEQPDEAYEEEELHPRQGRLEVGGGNGAAFEGHHVHEIVDTDMQASGEARLETLNRIMQQEHSQEQQFDPLHPGVETMLE